MVVRHFNALTYLKFGNFRGRRLELNVSDASAVTVRRIDFQIHAAVRLEAKERQKGGFEPVTFRL